MMRILFLDDDDRRHKEFKRNSIGNLVDHAHNAAEAICLLRKKTYDRVYLDYDLTSDPMEMSMDDYESGCIVVKWVVENLQPSQRTGFVIHSLNDTGSIEMLATLRAAGHKVHCKPWAWRFDPADLIG